MWDLMRSEETCRVVGITPDGTRDIVWQHVSHDLAERVERLIRQDARYGRVIIEREGKAP
ncbi:MAG TPA: hypothetical protein VL475_01905 [Planctomycetaceae bacterium]|jgi:hypothetical protein|nr:hypothetical protein [Planctomycetaceae bacterium]